MEVRISSYIKGSKQKKDTSANVTQVMQSYRYLPQTHNLKPRRQRHYDTGHSASASANTHAPLNGAVGVALHSHRQWRLFAGAPRRETYSRWLAMLHVIYL